MDFISTGTEILKQENVLTPRQKDIIDTEKEMLKSPFDRNTAIGQVEKNCMSYPELALGVTVPIAIRGRSLEQMTNDDILKILQLQFGILMAEEGVRGISSTMWLRRPLPRATRCSPATMIPTAPSPTMFPPVGWTARPSRSTPTL